MAKKKPANRKKKVRKGRRIHAKKRALQRHGLHFNRDTRIKMVKKIQNRQSQHVKRLSGSKAIYRVWHEGKKYPVVYSKKHGEILTFLEDEWL